MTFNEFKFKLKKQMKPGTYTFYVVPKSPTKRHNISDNDFPKKLKVVLDINPNKNKKYLDFESGFGCDSKDGLFFFEDQLEEAQAYATKLHKYRYLKLKNKLDAFLKETNFLENYERYSDKFPEVFV